MDFNERTGILEHLHNGFIVVGYHCHRCEAYWQMEMTLDDHSEDRMKEELCYACSLRKRLAAEIRYARNVFRQGRDMIASMEEQLNVLLAEREANAALLQRGSQIITQQDTVIRDLKKRLDKRAKKRDNTPT